VDALARLAPLIRSSVPSRSSASGASGAWDVHSVEGDAAGFHARDLGVSGRREIWLVEVDRPALVLGSTQPESDVDHAVARRLGVEVVRRRSGGGAVLLDPGAVVWVDAVVPAGDELWRDDVGAAFGWFGQAWAGALADLGVGPEVMVHEGPLVTTPLSSVVCFAGLGPGEVTVGGAKAVGLSQRRTRRVTRLQASLLLGWDPARHAALLGPGIRRARPDVEPVAAVGEVAVGPRGDLVAEDVIEALLARLP
jgi:lipoate-protein ligase A